jgi:hypothetical protein
MACKFLEIGLGQNLPSTIKEADQADHLFIGSERKLKQWSVSHQKLTKVYGDIMAGFIISMSRTRDKTYLFLSDSEGC